MISALAALLACQLAGETLVRALGVSFPGPVAGMGLLFLALLWRGRRPGIASQPPEALAQASDGLLRNLSILFVPAAVGIVQHAGLVGDHALAILVAIAVSTLVAMGVTAWVFARLTRAGRTS